MRFIFKNWASICGTTKSLDIQDATYQLLTWKLSDEPLDGITGRCQIIGCCIGKHSTLAVGRENRLKVVSLLLANAIVVKSVYELQSCISTQT
jgi:hypothetical protein